MTGAIQSIDTEGILYAIKDHREHNKKNRKMAITRCTDEDIARLAEEVTGAVVREPAELESLVRPFRCMKALYDVNNRFQTTFKILMFNIFGGVNAHAVHTIELMIGKVKKTP